MYVRYIGCVCILLLITHGWAWAEQDPAEKSQEDVLPEKCQPGSWQLTGADYKVNSGSEASYRTEWTEIIRNIADCTAISEMQGTCVYVRGHSDQIPFTPEIVAAFGSAEAAQLARARGRAISVISRLHELGVKAHKLLEVPPSPQPTYRGVEITLVPNCVVLPSLNPPERADAVTVLSEESIAAIVRKLSALKSETTSTSSSQAPAPKPSQVHHLWAEAGLEASFFASQPSNAFGSLIRLGAGWDNEWLYGRLYLAPGVGLPEEQRLAFEFGAGFGYLHAEWLQVGALAAMRMGFWSFGSPWLERSWVVGIEGTHCLFELWGNQVCIRETLIPLGSKIRRAEVNNDRIESIPDQSSRVFRFDAGVVMRRRFL